jgi:hypothetical protein
MSDFLVGLITVLIYIAVVVTWFFSLFDLFFRGDLGWSKALWLLAIVFVPIFGVLAYWIVRPRRPTSELWWQPSPSQNEALYAQKSDNITTQVETLARLRSQGAITDEEFNRLKEKAIA